MYNKTLVPGSFMICYGLGHITINHFNLNDEQRPGYKPCIFYYSTEHEDVLYFCSGEYTPTVRVELIIFKNLQVGVYSLT
jgi:hypothetical protein